MRRLSFRLPDFTRVSWVSEQAKVNWAPKIKDGKSLLAELEVQSVVVGQRRCALIVIHKDSLNEYAKNTHELGLELAELYRFGGNGSYSSEVNNDYPNKSLVMCAIGASDKVQSAQKFHLAGETDEIGRLLGYPDCCIAFFDEYWNRQKYIDTTWPMVTNSISLTMDSEYEACGIVPPENNMLLRCIGVRPVFHLPCSCECEKTKSIARQLFELAGSLGHNDQALALYEMLSLPVQWSALHGIAEIETPLFRISTKTDATPTKYQLRKTNGPDFIEHGGMGFRFPYSSPKNQRGKLISILPLNISTVKVDNHDVSVFDNNYFEDNGFFTKYHMDKAQMPIVEALVSTEPKSVLYLGCRNGVLLNKILDKVPDLHIGGIDPDIERVQRAHRLLPQHRNRIISGNVFDLELLKKIPDVDVVVFMLGRLLEVDRHVAIAAVNYLKKSARVIVVYAYADWLRDNDFSAVAKKFDIKLESLDPEIDGLTKVSLMSTASVT